MGRARGRRERPAPPRGHESCAHAHADPRGGRALAAGAQPQARAGRRGPRGAADDRPVRRTAAARVRRARAQDEPMMLLLVLALQADGGGWSATPAQPTVGDTIVPERTIAAPPGWRIRAGKLAAGGNPRPPGGASRGP